MYFYTVIVILFSGIFCFMKKRTAELPAKGKSVFISGCDSGIGQEVARHYLSLGMTVFAGCLHPEEDGAKHLRDLQSPNLHILPLDITQQDSVDRAVQYITEMSFEKGLWALVNNAGICVFGEFDWQTMSQCRQQIEVNFLGTIRLTKACLRLLRKASGRIIIVSSVNGCVSYPGLSIYGATKAALESLADALRMELRKFSIQVILVQPGDFARLTNIMKEHERHMTSMWEEMPAEEQLLYQTYFPAYNELAIRYSGITSPPSFQRSSLLMDMRRAALCPSPNSRILSAPLSLKVFVWVHNHLPVYLADQLVKTLFSTVFKGHALELHHE